MRGFPGIYQHNHRARICCFALDCSYQHSQGNVRDGLCQVMVFEHALDFQIFEGYYAKTVYKLTANLVGGIRSAVSDPLLGSSNDLQSFLPLRKTRLGSLGKLPLNPR